MPHPLRRHALIISRLSTSPSTRQEIEAYLARHTDPLDNPAASRSTFARDLRDIAATYGIGIRYKEGRYHLDEETAHHSHPGRRLLEAFQLADVLRQREHFTHLLHFEARRPAGLEWLKPLLDAARSHHVVRFAYTKFWEDTPTQRTVHPLALKEARGRWYLLATEPADNLKTFGLDRISGLEATKASFTPPARFDATAHFEGLFGALPSDEWDEPVEVVLGFTPVQARYVQTYPLHPSQRILRVTEEGAVMAVTLCPSYDFVMEILSFGAEVEVLQPAALREELAARLQATLAHYRD